MATEVIETPGGIAFAGFYYPEILRELLGFLRANRERLGLTDENDFEVHVQLLRAFSLVGHLNNVRLDTVATELLLDSATLLESVKQLLRLMGIELASASPAVADLVLKLSEVTTVDQTDFIPGLAEFATDSVPPIVYEAPSDGVDLDRMDQVKYVYGAQQSDTGTAGEVFSTSPDTFRRGAGSWATDVVGQHMLVRNSSVGNGGEFRVTERLSSTDIRVVRMPNSVSPGFITEGSLTWELRKYSVNFATQANTDATFFSPWAGTLYVGDALYVGHRQVMPTQLDLTFNTFAAGITGIWEYFDNERSAFNPTSVDTITVPGAIVFDISTLLGSSDASGAEVTVTYLKTGAHEVVTSVYSGGTNKITTAGLLGQVAASSDRDDYLVTADWAPFDQLDDLSSDLTANGSAKWAFPQTLNRSWKRADIVNALSAMWIRYRVVAAAGVTLPSLDRIRMDQGDAYVLTAVTQGETIGPQVLGSSSGTASQLFKLPDIPFIDGTELIEVDEGGAGNWIEYARVESFLNSVAGSRHYTMQADATGQATATFGDGANGKIPPSGLGNVRATYRIGGEENGNVGPYQIVGNSEGISGVSEVYNPRSAYNWRMRDGGDANDLKRVKRDAPAALRTRNTASNAEDCAILAVKTWVASDGTRPVARAFAYEEGFGVKTIKLLVVGEGGVTLSETYREELEDWFNGDKYARPPVYGKAPMNHRVYVVSFEPILVSITATIVWPGGNSESARNRLLAFLTPLAIDEEDQITYLWNFGDQVSFSRVHSLLHTVDPGVTDVPVLLINGAAKSYDLTAHELPTSLASSISVTIQDS